MRHAVLILGLIALVPSCGQKKNLPCDSYKGEPIDKTTLHLTFQNPTTGQDLFFSTAPTYPYSAFSITWAPEDKIRDRGLRIDTFNSAHNFQLWSGGPGKNTIYLSITGQKTDTLQYNSKYYSFNCSGTSTVLTDVRLNGNPLVDSLDLIDETHVLVIKKD